MKFEVEAELFFHTLEGFAGYACPEEEKEIWKRILMPKTFPRKTVLISIGEVPVEFYFIVKGLTRQYYVDNGSEVTRGFSDEFEFVATEVLIQGNSSLFNIETLEECEMLAFRLEDLKELKESTFMKDAYIGALERNVRNRLNRDAAFLMSDAKGRYEYFAGQNSDLVDRVKKIDLASYLGMTPESLSRIRSQLKNSSSKADQK